ncbi:MAG: FtsX-like permease family protein [Sphingobacteriales bacterium]|nr:MAG: FtsX-like permease family protein [Sphingobacteriales bacterium]
MKVIGVVNSFKADGEEEAPSPGFFVQIDTSDITNQARLLVKLKQDGDAAYEGNVHQTLSKQMRGADIEITRLTDMKEARNKSTRAAVIVGAIIAGFLIINVALGIFGVLWYNIHKRKGEIGLRRAIGATGQAISKQLLTEAILLATLSMLVGLFFAIQFPLLQTFDLPVRNFVIAIILSMVCIYVLVILCAWYPGKQAANIYPATALHED